MRSVSRVSLGGSAAAALLLLFCCGACFHTRTSSFTFTPGELEGLESFTYADWEIVLELRVDTDGRVDYAGLRAERAELDRFVALLAEVGPRSHPELFETRDARLAYYLNAYNAFVLFGVLEHEPLESVANRKADFFYFTRYRLDGAELSLYDLENDVVRAGFDEPRIHFALNCASLGCPRLPAEPFRPAQLEEQLARETERFLSEPRNLAVEDGQVVLSELFDWFAEDFGGDPLAWIAAYHRGAVFPAHAPVRYRPWDWSLNDSSR